MVWSASPPRRPALLSSRQTCLCEQGGQAGREALLGIPRPGSGARGESWNRKAGKGIGLLSQRAEHAAATRPAGCPLHSFLG